MLDNRKELMEYRLSTAKERLYASEILFVAGSYKDSINRSYYAMFTATRALLAMDGQDFARHSGVISYFQKEYIKAGIFDQKYSTYLSQAFQVRNNADYNDFYIASKADAELQLTRAKEYCTEIETYLNDDVASPDDVMSE